MRGFHCGLQAWARWQLSLWDAMIVAAATQARPFATGSWELEFGNLVGQAPSELFSRQTSGSFLDEGDQGRQFWGGFGFGT